MKKQFIPKDYQPAYPFEKRILKGIPEGENLKFTALFVGAGPASLAGAIRFSQLFKGHDISIGVIEKAGRLGGHSLSGAVINPIALKKLFPEMNEKDWPLRLPIQDEKMYFLTKNNKYRIPLPPTMKNKGFYTASLCEIVQWLGQKAEEKGIHIFPSTSAQKLIIDQGQVVGVQTTAMGLSRALEKTSSYQPPVNILAQNIFLADGVRGNLSQTWLKWKNISSSYPEHYALGVKEIWKVPQSPKEIFHTVGWPLESFGGSFLYPLSQEHIAVGLVGSMSASDSRWDLNKKFQIMKEHPFFKNILKGGERLEWGAKVIPEGGFHSIPDRLSDNRVFLMGDAAGLVHVPSLKGVHYAMLSGIQAVEYIFQNNKEKQTPMQKKSIKSFESVIKSHPLIGQELFRVRNIVQALQINNKVMGFIKAGLMILTGGRFPGNISPKKLLSDNEQKRTIDAYTSFQTPKEKLSQDSVGGVSKADAVYLSGNKTRDDIPSHLTAVENLPPEVMQFYKHFCPAGVYEEKDGQLIINAPNCVDCKATDVLGPWWSPREGGSGPDYNMM